MRKIFFFLLALCCAMMSSLPMKAQRVKQDGIWYVYADLVYYGAVVWSTTTPGKNYKYLSGDVVILDKVDGIGTIREIGEDAFRGMHAEVKMTLPNTIHLVNECAFLGADGLQSITLNEGLTTIGNQAFYGCSNLTSVNIPTTLTEIPWETFHACRSLTSIVIPSATTKKIGKGAFSSCTALESVNGGNADPLPVKTIGEAAFMGCTKLSVIRLSENLETIEEDAFEGCTRLEQITLPASLTKIEQNAFRDTGIKQVTTKRTTPQNITTNVFKGVDLAKCLLYVPAGCRTAYQNANGWKDFGQILEPGEQPLPFGEHRIGDLCYDLHKDYTATVLKNNDNKKLTGAVVIPSSVSFKGISYTVNEIEESAFFSCMNITSVTLPNSITVIPNAAFKGCDALQTITLPSSLTKIGTEAFGYCANLQSINLPSTLTEMGDYAFNSCYVLISVPLKWDEFKY